MKRLMGLDVGDKRIGVAVSDLLGMSAHAVETVERQSFEKDIKRIIELIDEKQVELLVVGLPKNMNNTLGPQGEKVQKFMEKLLAKREIEVAYWDERLTTVAAHRTLIEGNMSRKKRKGVVDQIAAVFILQGYLDMNRNKL